jgi:hypothetical protein
MEAKFIEEIPKTQNARNIGEIWKDIDGDFYYSSDTFIGKHIEIIFNYDDIFSALQFGCENIKKIVYKTIQNKVRELKQPHGLLVDYKIIKKEMNNENIIFKIQVTQCEADCG